VRALLASLVLCAACHAGAAPVTFSIGGERLVVDTVPGISDVMPLASPRLIELAETLTSASNRIILFGLTDRDIRLFMAGDKTDLKRYMLMTTPIHLERERVTAAHFKVMIDDAQRDTGKPPEIADYRKYLDEKGRTSVVALSQLAQTDTMYSVLLGARIPEDGISGWWSKPTYVISTVTFLLVRNKALSLSVFSNYDGPADVEWIRFVTDRWVQTILQLNK
jgi:hypothetical protein